MLHCNCYTQWVYVKPGLWTVDWTMDWTLKYLHVHLTHAQYCTQTRACYSLAGMVATTCSTSSFPNAFSPVTTGQLQMSTVASLASTTTTKSIQVQPSLIFASPSASMIPQQPTCGGTATVNTAPTSKPPAFVSQSADTGQLQMSTVVSLASTTNSQSIQVQPSLMLASPSALMIPQQPTCSTSANVNATTPVSVPSSFVSRNPNVNPFYAKFISGNIRVCQGCKGSLCLADYSVPLPPFDLTIS